MHYTIFYGNLVILILITIAFLASISRAENVLHRYKALCALYNNTKIYCNGGQRSTDTYFIDTFSLDLSDLSAEGRNTTTEEISKRWKVLNITDYEVEKRKSLGSVANENTIFFFGGIGSEPHKLKNISTAFHMDTETWETLPNYKDFQGEEKQISLPGITYSPPPSNKIYFYGGLSHFAESHTYQSMNYFLRIESFLATPSLPTDGMGFAQSVTYDIATKSWSTTSPQSPPLSFDSLRPLSFFDKNSNTIYYIGGNYAKMEENYKNNYQTFYDQAITFDVTTGSWGIASFRGDVPGSRVAPSITVLPSNNILLYGGSLEGTSNKERTSLDDFCYTLNLDTKLWARHNISLPGTYSSLAKRSLHSAILVQNQESQCVFIMFGLKNGNPLNDILILDVKYIDKLRFVSTYPYADQKDLSLEKTETPNLSWPEEPKISQGAIVAIACCCAAVAIAAIVGFILYHKKKRAKENQKSEEIDEIFVDWENIDKSYQHHTEHYYHDKHGTSSSSTSPDVFHRNYNSYLPPPDVAQSLSPHTEITSDINLPSQNSVIGSQYSEKTRTSPNLLTFNAGSLKIGEEDAVKSKDHIVLEKPDIGEKI